MRASVPTIRTLIPFEQHVRLQIPTLQSAAKLFRLSALGSGRISALAGGKMALIVQKYGGTSVGNTARLKNVAARVPTRKLAGRLFRQKRARRRALAALSFPEKISVLVQLQQMASDIRKVCGRKQQRPWNLGR